MEKWEFWDTEGCKEAHFSHFSCRFSFLSWILVLNFEISKWKKIFKISFGVGWEVIIQSMEFFFFFTSFLINWHRPSPASWRQWEGNLIHLRQSGCRRLINYETHEYIWGVWHDDLSHSSPDSQLVNLCSTSAGPENHKNIVKIFSVSNWLSFVKAISQVCQVWPQTKKKTETINVCRDTWALYRPKLCKWVVVRAAR